MTAKCKWSVVLVTVLLVCLPVLAQETSVSGNISGVVTDTTGAVVPQAKVTLTGPTGTKTAMTGTEGKFLFPVLSLGTYSVRVEKEGFRTASLRAVDVSIGKTSSVSVTLEPGAVNEVVEVTGNAVTVDTTSTAVGSDLDDSFYRQVPVARDVASLFYTAPGAADSGGAGHSNPSISGASGLENLYLADGVNITDSAFGGLGVFTRNQGSIGSGINLSFIKEVNVKTGGFEPQYGQATGGVVQMVTKSGSNQFHGEIGLYAAPQGAEATYLQTDAVRTNKNGNFLHRANFDADGELGGYVPGFKNHLFFFGDFNPSWGQQFVSAPPSAGLASLGTLTLFRRVLSYAGKLTWKVNGNHQIESSVFGDPTKTNTSEQNYVLNTPNDTAMSKWDYGTRDWVVRYNGTMSPTWLLNGSFTWKHSHFTESPKYDVVQVTDRTDANNIHPLQGFGFLEGYVNDSYAINVDTQKIAHWYGEHTFSIGYRYERPNYTDNKIASAGRLPVPDVNATGGSYLSCSAGDANCPLGQTMFIWAGSLKVDTTGTCTLCPLYPVAGVMTPVYVSFGRGEFDPSNIPTFGRYHAAYVNDSWQMNSRLTLTYGIRWEQWHMAGTGAAYTFTDNWAPRIGIAIDPWGDRKTKIYGNFGRYNYETPLDAAVRSLSGEKDILKLLVAPDSSGGVATINANGSLNVTPDATHILNNATGGIAGQPSIGASNFGTAYAPGTKMMYQDEYLVGAEHQFPNGLVISGRFIYRDMPRALDDVAGVSPEAYVNNPQEVQNYFIANPSPTLDLFPNENEILFSGTPPTGCVTTPGNTQNAVTQILDANGGTVNPANGTPWGNGQGACWMPNANGFYGGETSATGGINPDGKPDGFPRVIHIYKAVEIEANKAFSHNWMLRANWRIASLTGNYEGAFRNDNGQTDPNISSLFDFTNGIIGMLGDQYAKGALNTDRRHIVNLYVSYVVPSGILKSLELGSGVNILSGTPISELADHPAYGNSGEVPIGGRGKLGRTAVSGGVNLHADYPFKITEKSSLHLTADLFNITNSRPILAVDQNSQINFSPDANPDFQKVDFWTDLGPGPGPTGYQRPFYARFSLRLVF
jgi:Carboxypeptidase regulatory-like domain/TonB-dependent Receptor Plug Domain